jgi:hypothetical protein
LPKLYEINPDDFCKWAIFVRRKSMNESSVFFVLNGLGLATVLCLVLGLLTYLTFLPPRLRDAASWVLSPVLYCVAFVTPRFVPSYLHSLIAAFWFWVFRVGFYVALIFGFLPAATPS